MRLSVLHGAPQGRRSISQVLAEIAALPDDEARVAALRAGPRGLRELLHFAFGRHEIDLPTGDNIGIQPIPIDAYAENARGADHMVDFDLLHAEAFKLMRLFAKGAHPTLTSKRRLELYKDIVERLAADEQLLLEEIRRHRRTPFAAITAELSRHGPVSSMRSRVRNRSQKDRGTMAPCGVRRRSPLPGHRSIRLRSPRPSAGTTRSTLGSSSADGVMRGREDSCRSTSRLPGTTKGRSPAYS
jgi:hypothetical protein